MSSRKATLTVRTGTCTALRLRPGSQQWIQEFERVHWTADPNGNAVAVIDKTDPQRTQVSDAVGYMIACAVRDAAGRADRGPRAWPGEVTATSCGPFLKT